MSKAILVVIALFVAYAAATPSCSAWCAAIFNSTFQSVCNTTTPDFNTQDNCNSWCNSTNQTLGNDGDVSGNTLGCRIYHAGVAAGSTPPTAHCDHASMMGGDTCGTRCEAYCQNAMYGPCVGSYGSMSDCMTVCATFPTSNPAFPNNAPGADIAANLPATNWANNVQCRNYHAAFPSMFGQMDAHCAHGWPTGGNACQNGNDICSGYCQLYIGVCSPPGLLETGVTGMATCLSACQAAQTARPSFKIIGGSNWHGVVGNAMAPTGDNIDCRVYHSIAAISDSKTHCPHVWVQATTGPCAGPATPTSSPGSTSGSSAIVAYFALLVAVLALFL